MITDALPRGLKPAPDRENLGGGRTNPSAMPFHAGLVVKALVGRGPFAVARGRRGMGEGVEGASGGVLC